MAKNGPQLCSLISKVRGLHSGTDYIHLSYQSKFTLMKNALRSFIYAGNVWYQWRKKPRKKLNYYMNKNEYQHIWHLFHLTGFTERWINTVDEKSRNYSCGSAADSEHTCFWSWTGFSVAATIFRGMNWIRLSLPAQPEEPCSEARRGCWVTEPSLQSAFNASPF